MADPAVPRPRPCASCPYRRDVPSGIWAAEEYDKLPAYDGDTGDQPPQPFFCHQGDNKVCSGWLGYSDPSEKLAVRIGVLRGALDSVCYEYATDVPLFASGTEAAEHGRRDIDSLSDKAQGSIVKITRVRTRRGVPLEYRKDDT